jgi:aarF domain-containing kinase
LKIEAGNILIRRNPQRPRNPDVILLDHGLYVKCDPAFSHNYALVWKCLLTQEVETVEEITKSWGIRDVQLFASGTLQRPWKRDKIVHIHQNGSLQDMYELQMQAKERAKEV